MARSSLTLAVVAACLGSATALSTPLFSWGTPPVYVHTCNSSGPFNDAAISALARYPLVTIEKGQGLFLVPDTKGGAEKRIVEALAAVKAVNSSVFTLFYYNSILSWDMYDLGQYLEATPALCLRNKTGGCVRIPGDPAFPQPHGGLLVFDFTNPTVRKLWTQECANLTRDYPHVVDGCFADRAENTSGWVRELTPAKASAFVEAHYTALQDVQAALNASKPDGSPGILVANHVVIPGVLAAMIESFQPNEASILELATMSATGAIVEAHAGYFPGGTDKYCEEITNSLSAFLIGAGEGAYYHCSRGWISNSSFPAVEDEWLTWREEYSRPLGEPHGPAAKAGTLYTRLFSTGTAVTFDTATNSGTIAWSDGHTQVGGPGVGGREDAP